VLLKLSGFRLDEQRLPDGTAKAKVLRAVDRSKDALPLKSALRLVRLSPARYHAWKRADQRYELDDRSSCPRSYPMQLTPDEVGTIKEMVTASEYRHMPLRTLAAYAQRAGKVFASATTWAKLVRQRGWRRPRRRVYPQKPPIVSGTASRPPAVRPVGQEWRQTEVSPVACANHHSLNKP
jgi:hypothetical protein